MSEDKKPEYYHDIEIEKISLTSEFQHNIQHFDGVVYGYPSTLKLKLKNIGKKTFEGGDIHFNFHYAKNGVRQAGGGAFKITLPKIEQNKRAKCEKKLEFPGLEGNIKISDVSIVSKNKVRTRIKGNGSLAPKDTRMEEAKSEIFKKTITYVGLGLIIATLASTIGFGLWKP